MELAVSRELVNMCAWIYVHVYPRQSNFYGARF